MNSSTSEPQCFGDGRVEEFASAIAFQLTLLFPKNSLEAADDDAAVSTVQEYLQKFQTSNQRYSFPFMTQEEWEQILPLSVEKWKCTSGTGTKQGSAKKSFSLLDQLNSGGWALPVTLEELQEIPTISERLTKLNTIQYMDDVLPDWTEIQSFLTAGLQCNIISSKRPVQDCDMVNEETSKSAEESSSMGQNTLEVAKGYLKLHRKWFNLARSSAEYLGIQYGLCQNISSRISAQRRIMSGSDTIPSSSMELHRSFLASLLVNWHDMFLDMMQRDQYVEAVAHDLEKQYLSWLAKPVDTVGDDTLSRYHVTPSEHEISLANLLAQIDPQARCFASWVHLQSPQHLISLLEDRPDLLSILLERCRNPPLPDEGQSNGTTMPLLYCNSLAILRWILHKTRIALFPWHLAKFQGHQIAKGNDKLLIHSTGPASLLEIFLQGFTRMALFTTNATSMTGEVEESTSRRHLATQIQTICLDAIETIILGWVSGQTGDAERAAVVSQCHSKLSGLGNSNTPELDLSDLHRLLSKLR